MAQPPENLPEARKRKSAPAPNPTRRAFFSTLIMVLSLVTGAAVSFVLIAPEFGFDLLGIQRTQDAWQVTLNAADATRYAVERTAQANEQRALDYAQTQVALRDRAVLLDQTATRAANNTFATQTAQAVEGVRQQTQVALDFEATRSALDQNATQVELNFRATQSALGGASNNPNNPVITPTPPSALLDVDFTNGAGIDSRVWQMSEGWSLGTNGIRAVDLAWLLSQATYSGDTRFEVWLLPEGDAITDILLRRGTGDPLAVRYTVTNARLTELSVYRWTDGPPLNDAALVLLESGQPDIALNSLMRLSVEVQGGQLRILAGESVLTSLPLDSVPDGAVGVQVSPGVTVQRVRLTPLE